MPTDDLSRCTEAPGPFVSLVLPTPSDRPDAGRLATRQWRNLRRTLAEQGADEPTLAAVDLAVGVDTEAVTSGVTAAADNAAPADPVDDVADHSGGASLAVIASHGEVLLRRPVPASAADGIARLGPLPWLTPVIAAMEATVPHLVVLLDRAGAELWGVDEQGEAVDRDVSGADWPLRRTKGGGWSQRRIQQRAINTWDANAKDVAVEASALVRDLGAQRLLVAGESQVVSMFVDALPGDVAPMVRILSRGARDEPGNATLVHDEVRHLVDSSRAEATVQLLQRYRELVGGGGNGAAGPEEVVMALQQGLVDTLLVHDDPDDDRTAWYSPDLQQLALDDDTLRQLSAAAVEPVRLVDACVAVSLRQGAEVRIAPSAVLDGQVGAILRGPLAAN